MLAKVHTVAISKNVTLTQEMVKFELNKKNQVFNASLAMRLDTCVQKIILRRGRDSNPRYLAVNTLSKRARSATLTPLLNFKSAKITKF
jgi:hypothetical protein